MSEPDAPRGTIQQSPGAAHDYAATRNLVAVVSKGMAGRECRDVESLAAPALMERTATLFKRLADIDAFELELDAVTSDELVKCVTAVSGTIGGIDLGAMKIPGCMDVERRLQVGLDIPVCCAQPRGTAIVVVAAFLNGLEIAGKSLADVQVVIDGTGATGTACAELLCAAGLDNSQVLLVDSRGVVHSKRRDLAGHIREFALVTSRRTFGGALKGADVFIGASRPRALTAYMLRNMNVRPLIFLLAAADSDLRPDAVSAVRRDAVVATGRPEYPNQISGTIAFPALFRGALDVQAPYINDAMQLAAARAVADLARNQMCWRGQGPVRGFGPKYIVPHRSDARLLTTIAPAVAEAAIHSRAAASPREGFDKARYVRALTDRMFGNHLPALHAE